MKNKVWKDALFGAVGGVAGTFALDAVTGLISQMQSNQDKWIERELVSEQPTQALARKAAQKGLGVELDKDSKQQMGTAVHWGYGMAWGAIYGVMRKRVPATSAAAGLPFGIAFGLFGSGFLLPMFNLSPPAKEFPVSTQIRGLVAHSVYAATVEGVCEGLQAIDKTIRERSGKRTKSELREVA